jgi:hypothetical protein
MIVNDINKLKVGDVLKLKIIIIFLTKLILNLFLFFTEIIILLEFSKEIVVELLFGSSGAIASVFLLNKLILIDNL